MLPRKESPIMLRQNDFHNNNEANEYMSLFLSDMCFWEQTRDENKQLPPQQEAHQKPESRSYSPSERTRGEDSLTSASTAATSTSEPLLMEKDLRWRAAADPVTGRTYYYDTVTRVTQWDKPSELKAWERQQKKDKRKKERNFFREMEHNIIAGLRRGELIPGVPAGTNFLMDKPSLLSMSDREPVEPDIPPAKASKNNNKHGVRTISGLDERVLASLNQNAPSPTSSAAPSTARRSPENRNPAAYGSTLQQRQSQFPGRPPLPQKLVVAPDPDSSSDESGTPPSRSNTANLSGARSSEQSLDVAGSQFNNSHMRRNTGGTIFVKSTMTNPDVKATIKCVCGVYRAHIVQNLERKRQRQPVSPNTARIKTEIFRDDYELQRRRKGQIPMPSIEDISTFFFEYFRRSQMEHDTIVMSLIYVERLIKETNGVLAPSTENWRSILFSCMIMASKVWDDLSMWNVDFSNVSVATGITPFSLSRINELELGVLMSLGFDVRVPASEYAKYYFLIRSMLIRSGLLENAAAPLSKEEAKIFENRTSHYQNARLNNSEQASKARRSRSVDWEWFSQDTQSNPVDSRGPVLADKICLEQLVSLEPHQ